MLLFILMNDLCRIRKKETGAYVETPISLSMFGSFRAYFFFSFMTTLPE